jgi:hypothetical protein
MNLCYLLQYICNDCLFVPSLLRWIEVTPNCFCRDPTVKCTACYWCLCNSDWLPACDHIVNCCRPSPHTFLPSWCAYVIKTP